jgi:hypothetical protein
MANLRFSPGLLSSIRDFGSNLAGSQAGARSALTGAGAQPASLGGMLARNVGTMLGNDMRTPQEKIQQELAAIDPNDPQKMAKMYGVLVKHGTPEQQIAASEKLKELNQQAGAQKQLTDLRSSLKTRAKTLKLPESYNETIDNAGIEQLGKLAEDLRTAEFEGLSRTRRQPAINSLGKAYGLDADDIEGLTFEEVEKMGATGEGADSKRFQRQDGSVVQLPVRGGKVYYKAPGKEEGSWLTPQDAGVVEEDPNVQTIVNRVEKMGGKIDDTIAASFDTSYNKMVDIKEEAIENNRALQLVDEGILAGRFSGVEREIDMIVSGLTGRPTKNTTQNTIELMRQRAKKVLQNISALGAGSGVSNTDLKFMTEMTAKDLTNVTKDDVLRLLLIERDVIERSRQGFVDDLEFLQKKEYMDQDTVDYFSNKTAIPERYVFDEDDVEDIDLSVFNQNTQDFIRENK